MAETIPLLSAEVMSSMLEYEFLQTKSQEEPKRNEMALDRKRRKRVGTDVTEGETVVGGAEAQNAL